MKQGETWNESSIYQDAWSLRTVRRITASGLYNQTPTYHTNTVFSADGEHLVFASARHGGSALMSCHVPTGDITQLTPLFAGSGSRAEMHKTNGTCAGNGEGVTLQHCIAPRSGWVVFTQGRALRAARIGTQEQRTLLADIGCEWIAGLPSVDPGERHVILPLMSAHPQLMRGERPRQDYRACFADGGMRFRMVQVPLEGGEATTVYEEEGMGSAHCPHSPTDPNLVLIDRDLAPNFFGGSDGKTNRIWILNLASGQLTELPPRDEQKFQVHSAWAWDGQAVVYHGGSARGGTYFGAVDLQGRTIQEYRFHDSKYYGHVSAMAGRPAIIMDGNISPDMLLWLYYDSDKPRLEVIARHATNWSAMHHQYPHPHAQSDPTGRYISFNAGMQGRTDVFVVEV